MDKKYVCDDRTMQAIENLRNRLRDLVNGDPYVDIGTLLYSLNDNIGKMGGVKILLNQDEIQSSFFVRTEL